MSVKVLKIDLRDRNFPISKKANLLDKYPMGVYNVIKGRCNI